MAFINAQQRTEFIADGADLIQPGDGAVHREHAVGKHKLEARARRVSGLQLRAQVVQIVVLVAIALRLAQADAIDDGRVVQLVADDRVFSAEQRFEQPAVGVERRAVEDRVFGAEKLRQPRFQRLVQVLRAANEAHRAEAKAVRVERLVRRLEHLRVRRQAEVVVGAEVDDLLAVRRADHSALRRGDDALGLVETGFLDGVQFTADVRVEGVGRSAGLRCPHGAAPVDCVDR